MKTNRAKERSHIYPFEFQMKSLQTEISDHEPQVEKAVSDTEVLITQSQSSVKQELQANLHGKSISVLEIPISTIEFLFPLEKAF